MSGEPKMFRVYSDSRIPEPVNEVDFANVGVREREHIQEWIASHPDILGEDLLVIGKEFSEFDLTNERLDLLAVDADGKLVIVELKRDDTGADVHWQAIKYASYLRRASADDIVRIFAQFAAISYDEAEQRLLDHLNGNDLNLLNNDQRIIIASHRFAPEVTSAVLWLNEKIPGGSLITCVQLTPFQDSPEGQLFLQSNTIIPVPGAERYSVQVDGSASSPNMTGPNLAVKRSGFRDTEDSITQFARKVADIAKDNLSDELKPDRSNKRAGVMSGSNRYYALWYSRFPLNHRQLQYVLHFYPGSGSVSVVVNLEFRKRYLRDRVGYSSAEIGALAAMFGNVELPNGTVVQDNNTWLRPQVTISNDALDDEFAGVIAGTLQRLIEIGTATYEDFENDRNVSDTAG